MSNYTLKGTITKISDIQTFASGFQKRQFVVTSNDTYPQTIPFELLKDKIDLIDAYKEGQDVEVHFNLNGNAWEDPKSGETKYFCSNVAWKIVKEEGSVIEASAQTATAKAGQKKVSDIFDDEGDESDNLPFN